jgi:hypothetical protein
MFPLFTGVLFLIAFGAVGLQFILKMRTLRCSETGGSFGGSVTTADRYRPMLRLLSKEDLAFLPADCKLQRALRAKRRELFRGYLRCLTRDYAHLLAGVREAMVHAGMERPDLAKALVKNRVLFAIAICKVEFRLALHAAGSDSVEVSGLVDAFEVLRGQVRVLSIASFPAANLTA